MAWRVAESLLKLRAQVNAAAPKRDKAADGAIGDEEHASRSSDHNPWVKDGRMGVVTAIDITHDPAHGVDARALVESLRVARDPRVKFCISNNQVFGDEGYVKRNGGKPWVWQRYTGKNKHTLHSHTSVNSEKALYDSKSPWSLAFTKPTAAPGETAEPMPKLSRGAKGVSVQLVQGKLGLEADGFFGPLTEKAVKAFQTKAKIVSDGIVGPYTWEALLKGKK